MNALDHVGQATAYDLEVMVSVMNAMQSPLVDQTLTVKTLKAIATAFMDDVHAYCNISWYEDALDPIQTRFNLDVRAFRRERHWLIDSIGDGEMLDYLHPTDGSALFYGQRMAPDGSEKILFIANMEGAPCTLIPAELPIPHFEAVGWEVALATPHLKVGAIHDALTLKDSEGVVFINSF